LLTPPQARDYFNEVNSSLDNLSVVGIAGPGDPMANPSETLESLRLIREENPDIAFCISTNGLSLSEHIQELKEVGVNHLTITINSLNEQTLSRIYSWVRPSKRIYRGLEAGNILKQKQMEGLDAALDAGFKIKINTLLLPGINEAEIPSMAKYFRDKGVFVHNILPLKPVEGTPFGTLPEPDAKWLKRVRDEAAEFIPQMTHCQRCRADAVGILGEKNPEELADALMRISLGKPGGKRPYVAACSREGFLVNEHLGEARTVGIYSWEDNSPKLIEKRQAPPKGAGPDRWNQLAEMLSDCSAIMVSGVGPTPRDVLTQSGLAVHQIEGLIAEGVERLFQSKSLESMKPKKAFACGSGCQGNAQGCG